jgi:hypothetical protein
MDYIACNAMMCFTMHNFTVTIHSAEAEFDSFKESLTISKLLFINSVKAALSEMQSP